MHFSYYGKMVQLDTIFTCKILFAFYTYSEKSGAVKSCPNSTAKTLRKFFNLAQN